MQLRLKMPYVGGQAMPPRTRPRSFRVVSVRVPAALLVELEFRDRLDWIGPAYFVHRDQLPILNATGTVTVLDPVYIRETQS